MRKKLTSSEIISKLRLAGYQVRIRHERAYREVWVNASSTCKVLELQLDPMGGTTIVCISNPEGDVTCGMAGCRSDESYCKKFGVEVALGRAIKSMGLKRAIHTLPVVKHSKVLSQTTGLGRLSLSCYPDYKEELDRINAELRSY
jgi:hypothetical protein